MVPRPKNVTRSRRIHGLAASAYRGMAQLLGGTGISQVFPLNRIERAFRARMRVPYTEVDGHVFHLDEIDSLNLSLCGSFEPFEAGVIKSLVKPNQVVFDIGANIGFYTLLFARAVGPGGKVHAFEPVPSTMEILRHNIAANRYENVVLNLAAVSNGSGSLPLYLAPDNAVDHRLADPDGTRESLIVPALRLDAYYESIGSPVHLIKMDIQGAEGAVIETLGPLVTRNPGLILITEFWPYGLALHGTDPAAALRDLAALGFDLEELDDRRMEVRHVQPDELLIRCTPANKRHTNLLCRLPDGTG